MMIPSNKPLQQIRLDNVLSSLRSDSVVSSLGLLNYTLDEE